MALARLSQDVVNVGWTNAAGESTDLFQSVDETVRDDTDYILTLENTAEAVYVGKLDASAPPSPTAGHLLRIALSKDQEGGSSLNLQIELRQGYVNESSPGTLIYTHTLADVAEGFETVEVLILAADMVPITNFNDVYIRLVKTMA